VALNKLINFKGDLFATVASFGTQAVIKLGSSLVLTRILRPEAYGIITILMSVTFVIEMIADINVTLFIIRDKKAEEPKYLNTAWTLQLGRAVLNSVVLFFLAPLIANHIYHSPELALPLRFISIWFVVAGVQSMSFPIAIRRKRSRIIMYSELGATCFSTGFAVIYCYFSRDYWGLIYSTVLNRALLTASTYLYYPELRPKLHMDWAAAREILGFTKYTMPSSLITLALSQFDKIAFLRLFDLNRLGIYGLAGNITGPIESLITKISQMVLYPRCAHDFRSHPDIYWIKYYRDNIKVFISILFIPAAIGGGARLLIALLYDSRYALAGPILQAFMLRAMLLAIASPAEDLLIASGETQVILLGNLFRAAGMLAASLTGYYFFGFMGFVYGVALSGLPPLLYYLWLQNRKRILIFRYEAYKVAFVCGVALTTYVGSSLILSVWSIARIRI
jgi:O-antigen/teichoic acid export membrane protein